MITHSRKRPLPLLSIIALAILLFLYHRNSGVYLEWTLRQPKNSNIPANSTLGFGAVLVVSKEGSSRRHSLLQAANVTDIALTIPRQPHWTDSDVEKFRDGQDDGVSKGSILAWMGHLNVLQWFLDSGLETALVLEDDVDWDVRLRSVQIPLAANAARTLLPPERPITLNPSTHLLSNHTQYWGNHSAWDLLYLGHCGDYFNAISPDGPSKDRPVSLDDVPHMVYKDPTLPDRSDLHPFTQRLFDALDLPMHSRAFHRSSFPLCSFGYAVTRAAAQHLLEDLAPAKLKKDGPRAFDVALLHACIAGSATPSPTPWRNPNPHPDPNVRNNYASPGLRCWSLNSELFHHMPGKSQIAQVEEAVGSKLGTPPVDLAAQWQVVNRNETANIGCGFWNGEFKFEDGDMERLRFLQQEVGRKGRCLKKNRDAV